MISKNLKKFLKTATTQKKMENIHIFNMHRSGDVKRITTLVAQKNIRFVVNDYVEELKEYFQVNNPTLVYRPDFENRFRQYIKRVEDKKPLMEQGRWVYYPWCSTIVHILEEEKFQRVRTARNRNLITPKEQEKFYRAVVGIAGLSVGNSVALALVLQGGAKHIRLADYDTLALSNTNRIRAGVTSLGLPKVIMTARQIYELNPYAKIELFTYGLTPKNIRKFFTGPPKLDIAVDELDNLAIKYLIREEARRRKVAVVMGADNGDNAVIDIERYDKRPQPKFFHGRMGKVTYKHLAGLDKFGIGKNITKHIGPENVTERMRDSLLEMGKTIVSWPQLGGAALINGAAMAYCIRKIITGQKLEKNRSLISLDEKLVPNFNSLMERKKRRQSAKEFRKIFHL